MASWASFRQDVKAGLNTILQQVQKGENIAAFTSGGTISAISAECLGLTSEKKVADLNFSIRNTAWTTFLFSAEKFNLLTFNELPHLEKRNDHFYLEKNMAKKDAPKQRKDVEELKARQLFLDDKQRKVAVEKRHSKGKRTARENIKDLCDKDSFEEIGALLIAAQKGRKSIEALRKETPADGLISGIGKVNSKEFETNTTCYVLSYDYTVLAGTQGAFGHKKTDRMMALAEKANAPILFLWKVVVDAQEMSIFNWLPLVDSTYPPGFSFARLSGKIPRIAIVGGYCFAGNAAIAGCADVIIATEDSSLGMGGPAMIEGGGLDSSTPRRLDQQKSYPPKESSISW